ncbi:bifunctional lysine-specific demethylase and histidyl-hydroxylase NO66 isoform X3 [Vespula squamosa]|uniref:Bifunctional lysine-specific demethylase and histidyl-hydroxylase n=1 Tax=Vespula squamosa TaxID=30214 RepID=A0ABD2A2Z6_VESSQ
MTSNSEQISAFAAYAMKRKNIEHSSQSPKLQKTYSDTNEKNSIQVANEQNNILPSSSYETINRHKKSPSPKTNTSITKKHANTNESNSFVVSKYKKFIYSKSSHNSQMNQLEGERSKINKKAKRMKRKKKLRSKEESNIHYDIVHDNFLRDPVMKSKLLFEWLIHPLKINKFFETNWERSPVHIKRDNSDYYKVLMSTPILDKILRDHYILFTKNIDITSYVDGTRETHNPSGRAVPTVVWDYYSNGCSVRMLNPQTFLPRLHTLNATLQEYFGCFVGANSYLTPPGSQGFAPHYDDIEAFILQIEGKKRWRLYKSLKNSDYLPRYPSKDFDQSELGELILDTVVEAGDLLYLPRGTIHQGETIYNCHSLHVTLSVYQKNSWGDFLEKLLPDALRKAIANDSHFREGLPLDYLKYFGFVHSKNKSDYRNSFKENIEYLLNRIVEHIDIDKAADEMAKSHMHDFLPPVLVDYERQCSIAQDGERMIKEGIVENHAEIELSTKIRLLRSHCIRLVEESDAYKIYYSCENSKEYHEYELQFLEVDEKFVPAIKEIIHRFPKFMKVKELPITEGNDKILIVRDLWERGILITENPLSV